VREDAEKPLDLVHPRGAGGREVKDDARALRKPFVDGGRLVRGGIVENDLKLSLGEFLFERFQKGQEVPSGVRFPTVGQDMAAGNLQSGVQVKDAVAAVVVGVPFDLGRPEWKHRLRSLERLHLGLFVQAESLS
jgi:hypothetical protein